MGQEVGGAVPDWSGSGLGQMVDALECSNEPSGTLIYGEFHDYKRTLWVLESLCSTVVHCGIFLYHKQVTGIWDIWGLLGGEYEGYCLQPASAEWCVKDSLYCNYTTFTKYFYYEYYCLTCVKYSVLKICHSHWKNYTIKTSYKITFCYVHSIHNYVQYIVNICNRIWDEF
jgi:hypothetical protein